MKKHLILAAGVFGAYATAAQADIVVSSKIDTEGGLLGNVIALALEDAGLPVEQRLQLGGTQVVREAILAGQIDIYPEYTGNAAFFFNEADSDVWKDPQAAHDRAAGRTPRKTISFGSTAPRRTTLGLSPSPVPWRKRTT